MVIVRAAVPPAFAFAAAFIIGPHASAAGQTTWVADSGAIRFEVRNAGLPVRGTIGGLEAAICFDPAAPESGSMVASVDPATIETGIGMRDRHLQRRGWFEVAKYGRITMRSIRLWRSDAGFSGRFLLRMRDVEREVNIPFVFEHSRSHARVHGSLALDRLDWGIGGKSAILGDEVSVRVDLVLVHAGVPTAASSCEHSGSWHDDGAHGPMNPVTVQAGRE